MLIQELLTESQADIVERILPGVEVIRNHSWGQIDTVVLQVRVGSEQYIIKSGGPDNHHLDREITAFQEFTRPLTRLGWAATAHSIQPAAKLLILDYLPGTLVEGHVSEAEPDTYLQAGRILREFHSQASRQDETADASARNRAVRWLDAEHRIEPAHEAACRSALADYEPRILSVVPTHGDWQPRNWLFDAGRICVIDFGRFGWRSPVTDFVRLAAQQWRGDPGLERAFFRGYGSDPRKEDAEHWRFARLCEAIGTAVWAFQVGDEKFEAQGHRMIAEALVSPVPS